MKRLLLTLVIAVLCLVPSMAVSAPSEQQELCSVVGGIYNYHSPSIGKVDCVNTVLVYKFSTIATYKADVAALKMQTMGKHGLVLVFFSTAKTFNEESRIRVEVAPFGISVMLVGKQNGKFVTY